MQHWRIITPWHPPKDRLTEDPPSPPVVETRGAGQRAAAAIRVIDKALQRSTCVWCESGLYDSIPPICPGCGRVRDLERRAYQRPVGVPIEYRPCGPILSVR